MSACELGKLLCQDLPQLLWQIAREVVLAPLRPWSCWAFVVTVELLATQRPMTIITVAPVR